MKYLRMFWAWALCVMASHALAATVTVNSPEIKAGGTAELIVSLSNTETNITGYQLSLYLPDGITVATDGEGDYEYTLSSRHKKDHTMTIRQDGDGSLLIICYSASKKILGNTSGELFRLPLIASSTIASLQGSLQKIILADTSANTYDVDDVQIEFSLLQDNISFADANVKAICVQNWDTDGDGELSMSEAAAVTSLGTVFRNKSSIQTFEELEYFTGLTSIGSNAFLGCTSLTNITIPNSVTSIGSNAFLGCTSLTNITIPNSVTSIGSYAFFGCTGLTNIIIPNSVTSIGHGAFINCTSLITISVSDGNTVFDSRNDCNAIIRKSDNTLITGCKNTIIPNSVTSIGESAFYYCTGLTNITIPNNVTSIGSDAFSGCTSLTNITIPNSVTSIGTNPFRYCTSLVAISVSDGNTVFDSRNDCNAIIRKSNNTLITGCKNTIIPNSVTSIGYDAFLGCTSLTNITIPNSVTSIGSYAFSGCTSLTNITIPNRVTSIGTSAFNGCNKLTSVKVENPSPVTITQYVFSNRANAILYVPAGSKAAYEAEDYWKEFKEIIEESSYGLEGNLFYPTIGNYEFNFNVTGEDGTFGSTSVKAAVGETMSVKATDNQYHINETEVFSFEPAIATITSGSEAVMVVSLNDSGSEIIMDASGLKNQLYKSVGYEGGNDVSSRGAIPMPATHTVKYNGSIDLKPFIDVYYVSGESTEKQLMSAELMEQLGLHFSFKAIPYLLDNRTISEDAYVEETEDGVFVPRSVVSGMTITGKTATLEVVGHEPLIRVDLVYNNNIIVNYGYIKLRIVAEENAKQDMEVTLDLNDIYMNGNGSTSVTWSQMENNILNQLDMKKHVFEKNYFLDVVNEAVDYMPHTNPGAGEVSGALYDDAAANNFMAVRYYYDSSSNVYAEVDGSDAFAKMDNYTVTNNWFGRVWYNPHDDTTSDQNWSEQTNVLVWNIGEAIAGNMTRSAYERLMVLLGASYSSKGLSTKALSTVVRLKNKNTGTSVWVTLRIPAGKVHFACGDIRNRVLDHWYDYKQGYRDNTADTIEVYANVPTPAEVNRQALTFSNFQKDLKDYWLSSNVGITFNDASHFSNFTANGALGTMFQFRLPRSGVNTVDLNANIRGEWQVDGFSGNTYTLYLKNNRSEIWAKQNTAAGMIADELICTLTTDGIITYKGGSSYGAAADILNLIGMYDATGKNQKSTYLTGHNKRTFAAYVEINVNTAYYTPLVGKNYFNVRFLRPVNVWPAEHQVISSVNKTDFINLSEMLYIRDWRTYAVVLDGKTQKFGNKAVSGTGLDGRSYTGQFGEGQAPYSFYGISNLYVEHEQIRTDFNLSASERCTLLTNPAEIEQLTSIEDISALSSNLKIIFSSQVSNYNANTAGSETSQSLTDVIAFTNDSQLQCDYHIYVPISVEYPWGTVNGYTQKAWAVITVKDDGSDEGVDISQMDNVIYIEDTEAVTGMEKTLSLKMKNAVAVQTVQFDLKLPEGVTVVESEDGELMTASKERISKFDYFSSARQTDGSIRLLAQATTTNIAAGDGEIARIVVRVAEDMAEGEYPVIVKEALMVERDNSSHSPEPNEVQSKLTVYDYTPGDANGDRTVNGIDFNMIGNAILGYSQTGFNSRAADISGDGTVNAIDFNMVGNIILTGSTASAPRRAGATDEPTDLSGLTDAVYAAPLTIAAGSEQTLSLKMKNSMTVQTIQFDLYLPEGLTVVPNQDNELITASKERISKYNYFNSARQTDGSIRLLAQSTSTNFAVGDGEIATVTVKADAGMAVGNYVIAVKNILLVSRDNEDREADCVNTTLTVTESAYTVLDETSTTVPEATSSPVDIKVKRTLKAGEWSTVCLPFAMTEAQVKEAFGSDVELKEFVDYEAEYDADENVTNIKVNFEDADLSGYGFEANFPYLIKVSADISEFTVNSTVEPDENDCYIEYDNGKTGSRRKVYGTFYGTLHAQTTVPENCLFLSGNKFWYSTGQTRMKAFRGYFDFVDVLSSLDAASARINLSFDDSETTGVSEVVNSKSEMENWYDLQGRRVEKPVKGLYIKGNKKVFVK